MSAFLTPEQLPALPLCPVRRPDWQPQMPPPKLMALPYIDVFGMAMPHMPPPGVPLEFNRSPIMDVTNPGSSSPHSQSFGPPLIDQTRSVTEASASSVNSDGQFQAKDYNPGQQGVTVSPSSAPLHAFNGEIQARTLNIHDFGTTVSPGSHGLPQESHPDGQNLAHHLIPKATRLPVATNVDADRWSPRSSLPKTINIR